MNINPNPEPLSICIQTKCIKLKSTPFFNTLQQPNLQPHKNHSKNGISN